MNEHLTEVRHRVISELKTTHKYKKMKKSYLSYCALMFAALVLASCGGNGNKKETVEELSGAGATFPLPFYNVIFENYNNKKLGNVAYGGIGSGGGIRNLKDGIVDFAGSDAFLTNEEMSKLSPVVHVPSCMGAVVVAYNLQDVDSLSLSGDVVADIFAGKINKWNDPRITELNPNYTLPNENIMPVFRSDGSGTTFVFTDYLCKVSENWAKTYGKGKSVNFPYGQAAKGNPGVAGIVSQTKNAIGYIGSEYAFAQHIPFASIINGNGESIRPTSASISAAASGTIPEDTRTMITNSAAPGAYPISCFTWLVVYKEQNYSRRSKEQAVATLNFLEYILSSEAQNVAEEVHYAPLPQKVIELSKENLKQITFDGNPIKQ